MNKEKISIFLLIAVLCVPFFGQIGLPLIFEGFDLIGLIPNAVFLVKPNNSLELSFFGATSIGDLKFVATITFGSNEITVESFSNPLPSPTKSVTIPASSLPFTVEIDMDWFATIAGITTRSDTAPEVIFADETAGIVVLQFSGGNLPPGIIPSGKVEVTGAPTGAPIIVPVPPGFRVDITSQPGDTTTFPSQIYTVKNRQAVVFEITAGDSLTVASESEPYQLEISGFHGTPPGISTGELDFPDPFTFEITFNTGLSVTGEFVLADLDALIAYNDGEFFDQETSRIISPQGYYTDWLTTQYYPSHITETYLGACRKCPPTGQSCSPVDRPGRRIPGGEVATNEEQKPVNSPPSMITQDVSSSPGMQKNVEQSGQNTIDRVAMQTGNPPNLNNLEYVNIACDMAVKGLGLNFEFWRTYRSRITYNGVLGRNWSHIYDLRLVPHPSISSIVILYNGEGRGDPYFLVGEDIEPPLGHYRKIKKQSDGSLLLRRNNASYQCYFPLDNSAHAGKIKYLETTCGHRLSFTYNDFGEIHQAIDPLNRTYTFFYNSDQKLVKIRDFAGREVIYTYNSLDQLIAVRSPVIVDTPDGFNDFVNGKTFAYTYSSGFADERLNDNLISVKYPNQVATGGFARVVNHYNADDRLIMQDWGGTNSSGVAAGGSVAYARQEVNVGVDVDNDLLPREIITVIDRNNNELVYLFDRHKRLMEKRVKTNRDIRAEDPAEFITRFKFNSQHLISEIILPDGNRILYEYDSDNVNIFQRANVLSVTYLPDAGRGGVQSFIKWRYKYDPVFNRVIAIISPRGNDPSYTPQNGGSQSAGRYTTEFLPDYFEGGLDDEGCVCGRTIRDIIEEFDIDISSIVHLLNQGDINEDGRFNNCGNIVLIRQPNVRLRPGSRQAIVEGSSIQVSETRIGYNKFAQMSSIENPDGSVDIFLYHPQTDPEGDGLDIRSGTTNTGLPLDPNTGGMLRKIIRDHHHTSRYRGSAPPAQLPTSFTYDRFGNYRTITNGRGVTTEIIFNELNQPVEIRRAADVSQATEPGLVAFNYRYRIFYDFNNNVVKTELEYKDGNNPDLPDFIPTSYVYNILDDPVEIIQLVSLTETIALRLRYDANQNLTRIISPMAVAGLQPGNVAEMVFDERNLLFKSISAPGTADEREVTLNYTKNGLIKEVIDGEDNNGNGLGESTIFTHDGYDRVIAVKDAVGNEVSLTRDPESNVVFREYLGPIGGPSRTTNSTSGNVPLARMAYFFDELSRIFRRDDQLFISPGVIPVRPVVFDDNDFSPGDGVVSSFIDYDNKSRITFVNAASPASAPEIGSMDYDGADRVIRAKDAEGNEVVNEFDKNSNVIRSTSIQKNPSGMVPVEEFSSIAVYDSLDRLVRATDNVGQTRRTFFDSRNLVVKATDAQATEIIDPLGRYTAGNINSNGNTVHLLQDGLGRVLRTIQELRIDGEGGKPIDFSNPSNSDGLITQRRVWDKNSRVISVSDDNNNPTNYDYDNLNRRILTTFADGTTHNYRFDRDHNVIEFRDNNDNIFNNTFDGINRLVRRDILRAGGVAGTTLQQTEFDGLSRWTRVFDNNDPMISDDDSLVECKYDSLSRKIEEIQSLSPQNGSGDDKVISSNWREDDDKSECIYPNGRKIVYTRDKLDRIKTIADAGAAVPIAAYDYIGYRVLERGYGNGTKLTMLDDSGTVDVGYDNLPRLVQLRHLDFDGNLLAGYRYGYNRENHKLFQENLAQPGLSELYRYDSVYRLVTMNRGELNNDRDGLVSSPGATSSAWQHDGVDNWTSFSVKELEEKCCEPAEEVDRSFVSNINSMNEYDNFRDKPQAHDDNGNLLDDGKYSLIFDAFNRITEIRNRENNDLIAKYTYDAFNRRTSKFIKRHGEFKPDEHTVALYHLNRKEGLVLDSSRNALHGTIRAGGDDDDDDDDDGRRGKRVIRGVRGLFNTRAFEFDGGKVDVRIGTGDDDDDDGRQVRNRLNIRDQLTVEAFVCLKQQGVSGKLVSLGGSFSFEVKKLRPTGGFDDDGDDDDDGGGGGGDGGDDDDDGGFGSGDDDDGGISGSGDDDDDGAIGPTAPSFFLFTLHLKDRKGHGDDDDDNDNGRKVRIISDHPVEINDWVYVKAVYDGNSLRMFVDDIEQMDVVFVSGNVALGGDDDDDDSLRLKLGGSKFRGCLEEVRLSNVARWREYLLRSFAYDGWRVLEESERTAVEGKPMGPELVTKQYVDGRGIDEHLTIDFYDSDGVAIEKTRYIHENHRGDTIAVSDESGALTLRFEYGPYGEAYLVGDDGQLEGAADLALISYGFHGRRWDMETGYFYFRNRYYDAQRGRFLSRDPLGYAGGGMGLYEAMGSNPYSNRDSLGLDLTDIASERKLKRLKSLLDYVEQREAQGFDTTQERIEINRLTAGQDPYEHLDPGYIEPDILPLILLPAAEEIIIEAAVGRIITFGIRGFRCIRRSRHVECFTAGTPIHTTDGTKSIEEVEVGEEVVSSSVDTNSSIDEESQSTLKNCKIVKKHVTTVNEVYNLNFDSETITTTSEHPFWVKGQGWTKVANLKVGNIVWTMDGKEVVLKSIGKQYGHFTVYNIEVEGMHTYFVGESGILVHNKPYKRKRHYSEPGKEHFESSRYRDKNRRKGGHNKYAKKSAKEREELYYQLKKKEREGTLTEEDQISLDELIDHMADMNELPPD